MGSSKGDLYVNRGIAVIHRENSTWLIWEGQITCQIQGKLFQSGRVTSLSRSENANQTRNKGWDSNLLKIPSIKATLWAMYNVYWQNSLTWDSNVSVILPKVQVCWIVKMQCFLLFLQTLFTCQCNGFSGRLLTYRRDKWCFTVPCTNRKRAI